MKRLITWIMAMCGNKRAVQIRTCRLIKMCFDNVVWTKQSFSVGNDMMKDSNGEKLFYAAKEIDRVIKKLNKVLSKLS